MFFRKNPFSRPKTLGSETPAQRARRRMMMVVLVVIVGLLFWSSQEKKLKKRAADQTGETGRKISLRTGAAAVGDDTGTLSSDQIARLEEYARRFEERYGVRFVLYVSAGACAESAVEERGPGVFYLGICPDSGAVKASAPPLVASLLGRDFLEGRAVFFAPYFKDGDWPRALAKTLSEITDRLDSTLEPGNNPAGP